MFHDDQGDLWDASSNLDEGVAELDKTGSVVRVTILGEALLGYAPRARDWFIYPTLCVVQSDPSTRSLVTGLRLKRGTVIAHLVRT